MIAVQKEAFPVAGLMYANVNAFDKAKPDHQKPEAGNDFPPINGIREFIATAESRAAWDLVTSTRGGRDWLDHQRREACYIPFVAAKSATGRGNPNYCMATPDAPSVFFCVDATAHPFTAAQIRTLSMVALVGRRSRLPESIQSGISTPANVTAISERGNSGGDSNTLYGGCHMATIPTQKPSFVWLIAAVRRDYPTITAKIHHIAAETEQEARRSLARDHVCFFAGRIRTGGAHA